MAVYSRSGVIPTETIVLRALFTDDTGCLVTPDAVPTLYIYDESVDTATVESEIAAATFTSALSGPHTATLITTGFYEYSYTVPSGSSEGTWHDVWVAALDSVDSTSYQTFQVEVGAVLTSQSLNNNEFVVVDLDSTIASSDSTPLTLSADTALSFTTTYSPYYASVEMARMEIGPFISFVPDDTLAMMLHWSSQEADQICRGSKGRLLSFAREKFVVFDAVLRAIMLPNASTVSSGGHTKTLGDLSIKQSGQASGVPVLSSGVDFETISYIRAQRDEWWRVVNAGGSIVPGESLGSEFAVKGLYDPDRASIGRRWDSPRDHLYPQPGANTKHKREGHRRSTFFFKRYRKNNGY